MSDPHNSLETGQKKRLHHQPAEWVDFGYRPIQSLARITRKRRREWRNFFETNRQPGIGPFCGPDIWIPWFFANPHRAPLIFEKRDSAGYIEALLPLCWNGREVRQACNLEFSYQELVANSEESGLALMLDVLKFCEERRIRLTLGKVIDFSLLWKVLKQPAIIEKAEVLGQLIREANSESFPISNEGLSALDSTYPVEMNRDEIRHFAGNEITGSLISEIAEGHRHTRGDTRYFDFENLEHFLTLQTRNTDQLCISTKRSTSGDDIESYLIGYFDSDTFHVVTLCHFTSSDKDLLNHTLHHFYTKTKGPIFRVFLSGRSAGAEIHQVFSYTLFPRKSSNPAKIKGYQLLSKAKELTQQLVRI